MIEAQTLLLTVTRRYSLRPFSSNKQPHVFPLNALWERAASWLLQFQFQMLSL